MEYYQLAVDQGCDFALYCIGTLYEKGLGVEQSLEKAVEYYREAANRGEQDGQDQLNRLAEEGKITEDYQVISNE